MVWQIHTLFLCFVTRERSSLPSCQSISGFPPEKDCIGNRPRAIRNRYPASPRKRLHLQQAMEMENEGVIRADVGNTRNYNSHDRFGRSPVFEGKKTGEKGGRQVARVCTCCGNKKRGPISTYLTLSVRGHNGMSTDRRECDAWAQVKARGEDGRANHKAAPTKQNRNN